MTDSLAPQSPSMPHQNNVATVIVAMALGIYWAALFYGTHTQIPPGMLPGNSDKFIHLTAYAGLAALLISLRATRGIYSWFNIVSRWGILALYGAFDELTQLLVNRTADFYDWCADMIGSTVGLGIVTFILWCFRKSTRPRDLGSSASAGTR